MDPVTFFRELKRRRVIRVAAVYAVVAFVLVQVADLLVPALLLPDWVLRFVAFLLILGFPVALVLAWAFDLTPAGVRRAEPGSTDAPKGDPARAGEAGPGAGQGGAGPPVARAWRGAFYGGAAAVVGAALLFVYLGAGAGPDRGTGTPLEAAPSIAVLPFVNMSADAEQEYFADGLTEDLLTNLSWIEGLRVISRTSVMRYKGSPLSAGEIASELGVTYVLEGSVRRDGEEVRITAQLIDAARDEHIWADRYDRELTGIFRIQGEIAARIADALEHRLSPAARARIGEGGTGSLTAYELLLRGREYLNRPGETDLGKYPPAIGFFRQALEVDPGYARGYASMAEAYRRYVALPLLPVRRDSVRFYAERAVALDPDLPEAVTELGFGHLFGGDLDRAGREFRRALDLDPNQPDALNGLARIAALSGRLDEAVRRQRGAVAVDPVAAGPWYRLAGYLFDLGDVSGAAEAAGRARTLAPDQPEVAYVLALTYLIRGQGELGEDVLRRLVALAPDHPGALAAMGRYQGARGRFHEAESYMSRTAIARLGAVALDRSIALQALGEEARARELVRPVAATLADWEAAGYWAPPRGLLYLQLLDGDHDAALATLREHWRSGLRWVEDPPHIGVYWVDREPVLEGLRDDPRFGALLADMRVGLDSMRALVD